MGLALTLEDGSWLSRIGEAPDRVRAARDGAVNSFMLQYLTRLQTERLNGDPIKRRTGNLANQWTTTHIATADSNKFGVKSLAGLDQNGVGYSLLQEHGGDITPKNAKYLWIPIADNLTGAGVPRMTPTQAIQAGGFIAWNKGPIFFGVDQKGRSKKSGGLRLHPLFVLKKSVHVEGRMGGTALWESMLPDLKADALARIKEAIVG